MPSGKQKSPPPKTPEQQRQFRRSQDGRSFESLPPSITPPPAHSTTEQSSACAQSVVTPTRSIRITGRYLVDVFKHVIHAVPGYADKWFTAEDWLSILPTYWTPLKGSEAQIKTTTFTKAMNQDPELGGDLVLRNYFTGNKFGVYLNQYTFSTTVEGEKKRRKTYCYLFTKPNHPCPSPPTSTLFKPYNNADIRIGRRTKAAARQNQVEHPNDHINQTK